MKVLVAPDKFRGTLTAHQAAEAMAAPLEERGHEVRRVPLADGGEGTLAVLGGSNRRDTVSGPLGDPVEAPWRLRRGKAVIEMAAASGLALVDGAEGNDPVAASTRGTGELISLALEHGATDIVVALGGSATTDGGRGALEAMFPIARFARVNLHVACDVRTKFTEAAATFAPQKGATPKQVEFLTRRLEALVGQYLDTYGVDVSELDGAGAAGGLAGGLAAVGARLESGFDLVADHVGLDEHIEWADVVITGEGVLDDESFDGKTVGGVLAMAERSHEPKPVVAVVGDVAAEVADEVSVDPASAVPKARLPMVSLVERYGMEAALDDAASCVSASVVDAIELLG